MAIEPKIDVLKEKSEKCARCEKLLPVTDFPKTHSLFFARGHAPVCNHCIDNFLKSKDYAWDVLDELCQCLNIPWIVSEWTRIADEQGRENAWNIYSKVFSSQTYDKLGWKDYDNQYRKLKESGNIDEEIPLLHEEKIKKLQYKWGANYAEEDLNYLEDLHKGLLLTQNVAGPLQDDQAKKICKLSLEIDNRIRAGDKDVDKFLSSYDKLVKTAEFTPKNTKNATDFDSWAELAVWLEKKGRINKFYDGATRDVIDETLKNIQNYNQKLYVNEGGIGEAITERLTALQQANRYEENDTIYDIQSDFAPDEYDNEAFLITEENNEFIIDGDLD